MMIFQTLCIWFFPRGGPLVYKWSIFHTSESLDHAVCNTCILLPNRGHAVQFLVMIYMDMAEVSLTLVLQRTRPGRELQICCQDVFCGWVVKEALWWFCSHSATSSCIQLPFLPFQGTWVHVLQSVSGEGPHTLSRATFGPSKLGPPCNENLAASEHPSITGHLRSFDKLGFIRWWLLLFV